MSRCKRCGSYAINPALHGREPDAHLDLCDVCYWRHQAEALAREVAYLRHYGNKDCTAMADAALAEGSVFPGTKGAGSGVGGGATIAKWEQIARERPSDNMTYHAPTIQAILKDLKGEA